MLEIYKMKENQRRKRSEKRIKIKTYLLGTMVDPPKQSAPIGQR